MGIRCRKAADPFRTGHIRPIENWYIWHGVPSVITRWQHNPAVDSHAKLDQMMDFYLASLHMHFATISLPQTLFVYGGNFYLHSSGDCSCLLHIVGHFISKYRGVLIFLSVYVACANPVQMKKFPHKTTPFIKCALVRHISLFKVLIKENSSVCPVSDSDIVASAFEKHICKFARSMKRYR